ncbi:MAG: hypothetical protein OXC68_01470, partial [Aestuariivita sp.]|nr:hypothetical protein [Aestuariivita sp.]
KILKIKVCSATTFFKVLNIITFLHKMLKMGLGCTILPAVATRPVTRTYYARIVPNAERRR